ncbi:MAG: DNA repair protein RecN, partial [Dehalococcoidia bacterium]
RRRAAAELAEAVGLELSRLGMEGASFAVGFACSDDPEGLPVALPDYEVVGAGGPERPAPGEALPRTFGDQGVDQVEFLASFNRGEDRRPLAAVASGGETSRFLLALAAVFSATDESRTIVLDEADEGVGGRSGSLVGDALARLAERHQVICVTHLPQVAARGRRHFVVSKGEARSGRPESACREVSGGDRLEELAAMLGGRSAATLKAAEELLSSS